MIAADQVLVVAAVGDLAGSRVAEAAGAQDQAVAEPPTPPADGAQDQAAEKPFNSDSAPVRADAMW